MKIKYRQITAYLLLLPSLLFAASSSQAIELTLAVANSTCNAIQQVGELFEAQHDVKIQYLCKSSGRLAKGLTGGAIEADIYISASQSWMNHMTDAQLIDPQQIVAPWGNALVVAVPINSTIQDFTWDDLSSDKIGKILIGDPGTAPFGRYAKQALETSSLWDKVKQKIVTKKHITLLADALAGSDAQTVGILFLSNADDRLKIIHKIDSSWHSPIRYYMGTLRKNTNNKLVSELFAFIQSETAKAIFSKQGFELE